MAIKIWVWFALFFFFLVPKSNYFACEFGRGVRTQAKAFCPFGASDASREPRAVAVGLERGARWGTRGSAGPEPSLAAGSSPRLCSAELLTEGSQVCLDLPGARVGVETVRTVDLLTTSS